MTRYAEYNQLAHIPPKVHICDRCFRGVVSFLGQGTVTMFEPSEDRPIGYCYSCGKKGSGKAYVEAP